MPEIELKLELESDLAETLLSLDQFKKAVDVSSRTDFYFDTAGQALRKAGFSLRIRKSNDKLVQTIKATQFGSSDIYARGEWEMDVPEKRPVLDHSTPIQHALNDGEIVLDEQFSIHAERRAWIIEHEGSRIEASFDSGVVVAGDRQRPICELELELKDGKADALFALTTALSESMPLRVGVVSKSERGYYLIDALQPAYKAESIKLDRSMSAAQSLQIVASACFRQYRLNEAVLLKHCQPEALHQARVALRRLRSAFVIYKPILTDDDLAHLTGEIRWLASVLGEARDIDVLLARAPDPGLREHLTSARERAYEKVLEAIHSRRGLDLFIAFNKWLRCGDYLHNEGSAENLSVVEFAGAALDRMRKKLKRHGRALDAIDDEHRHEARKDAKKLRYAAEFFSSLYLEKASARRYKRFLATMQELQDQLGDLNDLVTGPVVLDRIGLGDHPNAKKLVPQSSRSDLIASSQAALEDLTDLKRFWR